MDSPLLQYAREENQRASQLQASMGAEAIGFELAQQKMSMDKEAKDRAEKMGIEAALYQAAPRGSASRIEIGGRWADLLGIPREKITGMEEEYNTDLEMLFDLQRQAKKDPLQAGAMKEHQQRMYAKYGGYPQEPEKKYDVQVPGGPEGGIELGGQNAATALLNLHSIDTQFKEALEKMNSTTLEETYKAAKDEWTRLFESYKTSLPVDMQMIGNFETFMEQVKKNPTLLESMQARMSDNDKIRFSRIRDVFDAKLGLTKETNTNMSVEDFYKNLGVE